MADLLPFPSVWHALVYVLIGAVIDRFVVARLGWTLERGVDWLVFGMAHWFWPLSLLGLAAREAWQAVRS